MSAPPPSAAGPATARKNRRTFYLIGLVALAPVVASYAIYYWFPPERQVNYGQLLPTGPVPSVAGSRDGKPFRLAELQGKWVLAVTATGTCDSACAQALYAMRQARTIQGREMDRVVRVLLLADGGAPDPAMVAAHPDLIVVHVATGAIGGLPGAGQRIVLVDPLGNLVLAYPRDPDIKGLAKDLTRLLKASRIG
jgi:hypothetical protein